MIDLPSFSVAHGIFPRSVQRAKVSDHGQGSSVLIEIPPHNDVFVEANTRLGEALQVMYSKTLELDDAGAVSERETAQ